MKMSFHRRRTHESLPPRPARSPKMAIIAGLLLSATVAFAASRMGQGGTEPPDPAVLDAEQGTHDHVDERVRLHLRGFAGR